MELIRSTARNQVDLAAGLLAELRRVAVGLDLELQNTINIRADDKGVEVRVRVEGSVDQEQVGSFAVAVDVNGGGERAALGSLAAAGRRRNRARHKQRQLQELPAVERKILHLPIRDHAAHAAGISLKQGSGGFNGNFLPHLPDLKLRTEPDVLIDLDLNAGEGALIKARVLD